MRQKAEDRPQPPCQAYRAVEQVLPPWWLVAHTPPDKGRKIIVTGLNDRICSYWEMDVDTARFVFDKLQSTGAPVHCSSAAYDNG